MFCGRAERIAKIYQAIEPRNDSFAQGYERICRHGDIKIAHRIHEERGAAAHFIAEKPHAVSRLVK